MLRSLIAEAPFGTLILEWIEAASLAIEILAVFIIVVAIFGSTIRYFFGRFRGAHQMDLYDEYRHSLARTLLLGLEILVAADVVRTVALEATIESVIVLGLLVLIRTFLSWSLTVEIEGYWPWRRPAD